MIISTLAAVGIPKLKLMITEDTIIFRTMVTVSNVKAEIVRTQSLKKLKANPEESKDGRGEKSENEQYSESDRLEKEDEVHEIGGESPDNEKAKNAQLVKFIEKEAVGAEAGLTPHFIVSQASENLVKSLDDLFNIFDNFQNALYGGEAQVAMKEEKEADEDKAVYEESILITILGENYMDYIEGK